MRKYLIAYDRHDGDDYRPMIQDLVRLGAVRVQRSLWEMSSSLTASAIFGLIAKHLDVRDKLLVTQMTYDHHETPRVSAFRGLGSALAR